ncbi:MAG: hypothetical protein R3300_00400 [Candidatus Promineifilaceae bacterium]|nr:hypothetical protein [Candidatus Promineifilaceae bacterium]
MRRRVRFGTGFMALLLILLVACIQEESAPTIPPPQAEAATATAEPTATAVLATPRPTVTTAPTATPLPVGCALDWFFRPAPVGCPASEAVTTAAAEQPFDFGFMIWLAETDSIYAFFEDGRWRRYDDTWSEDQPESDPTIVPPEGRQQPIRGFGKVWREQPTLLGRLGWALGPELGFESTFQFGEDGADTESMLYVRAFNGEVLGLIERQPDQGEWVVAASN